MKYRRDDYYRGGGGAVKYRRDDHYRGWGKGGRGCEVPTG